MLRHLSFLFLVMPALSAGLSCQQQAPPKKLQRTFSHRNSVPLADADAAAPNGPWTASDHAYYADHALLVRDSASFKDKPAWNLSNLLQAAMRAGQGARIQHAAVVSGFCGSSNIKGLIQVFAVPTGTGSPETTIAKWVKSFGKKAPGCLDNPPIRLLAIVNRADFGRAYDTVKGVVIRKAEVRFVFGAVSDDSEPQPILGILEFVVRDMAPDEFRAYVQKWSSLGDAVNQAGYNERLASVVSWPLENSISARLRLEIQTPGNNSWKFAQFRFKPGSLLAENLDREIPEGLRYDLPSTRTSDSLKHFAQSKEQEILSGDYTPTGNLTTKMIDMTANPPALTLDATVLSDEESLRRARFILSINTCTGCHVNETQTNFNHIANTTSPIAPLSPFLTGSSDANANPSLNLVSVHPTLKAFNPALPPETYHYNDLLRRHLYMDRVLQTNPSAAKAAAWNSQLIDFMVEEIH